MAQYTVSYYNTMKESASNTWAFIVLPGHVRACFFCGELCMYGRKEVACDDISDMLQEQSMLCSTDVFHNTMRNMLHQCQEAYRQSTPEHDDHNARVLACTACYNWIMHRRQTLPFITPVQILHWFFNTLSNTIPKSKIADCTDARMVESLIARHFFDSCKRAPIVLGCHISNFLRHNMKDDSVFSMNVYRMDSEK
jgi:hypothetical protein